MREREEGGEVKAKGRIEFGGTSLSSSRLSKRHSFNQRAYNPRPVFRIKIGILEIAAQCVPVASGRLERSRSSIRHLNVLSLPPSLSLSLPILFDLKVFHHLYALLRYSFAGHAVLRTISKIEDEFLRRIETASNESDGLRLWPLIIRSYENIRFFWRFDTSFKFVPKLLHNSSILMKV